MDKEPIGRKINILARLFNDSVRKKVNEAGISSSFFYIFGILVKSELEGKRLTQKDLCNITSMKAPTISLTLQEMEREGYIKKNKSSVDGRVSYICITEKGHNKSKQIQNLFKSVDRKIEDFLSEEELIQFNLLIDRIINRMKGEDQ